MMAGLTTGPCRRLWAAGVSVGSGAPAGVHHQAAGSSPAGGRRFAGQQHANQRYRASSRAAQCINACPTIPPAGLGGPGLLRASASGATPGAAARAAARLPAGRRPAGVLAAACHAVHNTCRVLAHLAPPHVAGALAAARVLAAPALTIDQAERRALAAARSPRGHDCAGHAALRTLKARFRWCEGITTDAAHTARG